MADERDEYPCAGKRSVACFEGEIAKLRQQRDDLLAVCELVKSTLGEHVSYHIKSDTALCARCKAYVENAVLRIGKVIAVSSGSLKDAIKTDLANLS